ncbi:MAG: ABC transporter ATP-binding protein [Deltaproteobacteria bacterium]|nr:ABC transporter ATP-binding protein [Deltaproteobacteria bacterium]MBW2137784.1 ABC transporter ATP-binding protein [Deltaproteobacteria bacterium]
MNNIETFGSDRDKDGVLIDLRRIYFKYPGANYVLRELSLRLYDGERVGLVGPNGSGKTTLFHVIMGLLKPERGTVEIFDRERSEERDFLPVRQQIGLLFQDADDQLFSPTVLEDVAFGPLNQGKSVLEAKEIARETLRSLGLEDFEKRVTHKLSGGEKKLVSLATVLAMKPKVLLLDEPTNGLDRETTERIIGVLKEIEMSYIFISHNIDFIAKTTDKIYGLRDGRIVLDTEAIPHTHVHSHGYGELPHTHSPE